MCRHHAGQSQTAGPAPLPTAAEIALVVLYRTLSLLVRLCQLSKHCGVAAAKRYIHYLNSWRNFGNSGRFRTSLSQNFDVLGAFCGRKYSDVI